ncbi:SPOR domain-containing protein [Legionella rowbothamii]|uniref:SPOR domain-containing protein n=1 Tax=Legionella rowbothamii TaxID=96229 RepID=UPI00105544CF|nr:SPOR domain-containing protein [Legionella rowbothamii]
MRDGLFQSELAAVVQPRTLLKPESWLSKIEFINHLILFNNTLITVLSEKAGGKTSFASLLQENLDPQINPLVITIKAPCNREGIISSIADQFHLKQDEHTDMSSLVAQINERRAHVLLMIDDAQHLPEVFIKEVMLAIKNQENFNFFHLCLFSDYSIVAALNGFSASFFNGLVHTIELGVLTEVETRTYVLERATASRLITKPLSEVQLKKIYQLTKGNVAKINSSLESFIFNFAHKKELSTLDMVKKFSIPVGSAVLSTLCCLFIVKAFNQEPPINRVNTATKPVQQTVLASQIPSWQDSATRELVEHKIAVKQNLDLIGNEVNGAVITQLEQAQRHAKIDRNKAAIARALQEKLYTIQLVASTDKIDMKRYIKSNKLLYSTAKLNHYKEHNVVWYVLTIGEYSNMTDAQDSIKKLPPSLKRLNPWVRPIATLG